MSATLQAVLDAHAVALPGRDRERERLLALVTAERPLFACVHGIAGIGKSALLRAFACDAREQGARVLEFDCGAFEPTERGFLEALGEELGTAAARARRARRRASATAASSLVLDGYEQGRLLDHWLRRRLVPALPAGARLLVAGREEPTGWRRSFGELALFLRLGSLDPGAAEEVLARAGVTGAAADRVGRLAQGHPLALQLAAGVPDAPLAAVEQLSALYLRELAPEVRRALEAACEVRRPTASVLAAMLPGQEQAVEALRALPFVELRRDGLAIHDTIRAVTVALRSAADPAGRRRDRVAAYTHLRAEARTSGPAGALARHGRPAVPDREPRDPRGLLPHRRRGLRGRARDARRPLGDRGDRGAARAAGVARAPARLAARRARGVPRRARAVRRRRRLPRHGRARRGAARALPRGPGHGRLAGGAPRRSARTWRGGALHPLGDRGRTPARPPRPPPPRSGSTSSATTSSSGRRSAASSWPRATCPRCAPRSSRWASRPSPSRASGRSPRAISGPGSTDGWFAGIVAQELGLPALDDAVDAERRELRLGTRRVELSPREWDLLAYLRERAGRPVPREALARDVWGHAWTGGSANAIEAVVSSLRRKLGDRAGALQTVRGVGYRLDGL